MQSINKIGRALVIASALSLPTLALAEPPADSAHKTDQTPKKDKDAAHKQHAAKAHKDGAEKDKKPEAKPAE